MTEPSAWNSLLLPELLKLAERVNQETESRLIHVRGLARLSAWFAFGYTFSVVARYTLEVDQQGKLWRTDTAPNPAFTLVSVNTSQYEGEVLDGRGTTVAIGVSVTGSLDEDVRTFLASRQEEVAALLLLQPAHEVGRTSLQSAGDAVALADQFKARTRPFVKRWHAQKLLLFYFGPLSGACFIGHQLNALCSEIQIMEDQQPGYAASFILR